jgi:heparanase
MKTLLIAARYSFACALALVAGLVSGEEKPREPAVASPRLDPAGMRRIGMVDERYQSYNVEMLEVTGGRFWRPYRPELDQLLAKGREGRPPSSNDTPSGMNPALYQYRAPIDLSNSRLRTLARALGPAYVRVSGTWANTTYFPESDRAPAEPPTGYSGVLTQQQWRGVIDFAHAVNAAIVTSFATSPGTRDPSGMWRPEQAQRLLAFTQSAGGTIAAAEFMNEPTLAAMGGALPHYDAEAYGRDFKAFRMFIKGAAPQMRILGPGSVGETVGSWGLAYGGLPTLNTADLLAAMGSGIDAFSYHHYGASSKRCASAGMPGTTVEAALSEEWLARTDQTLTFYRKLRDEREPRKRFWVTETADAACGGNPWASTFLDSFRYLDQLGRLARQEVTVVAHNTLAASDYGLLDQRDFAPRLNYWAALLWRRLMGSTVLESGVPISLGFHVYAHCMRGVPGGVVILAINNDPAGARTIGITTGGARYTLSADRLQNQSVRLNGTPLQLDARQELPSLNGVAFPAGELVLAPATISFLALPAARNSACLQH